MPSDMELTWLAFRKYEKKQSHYSTKATGELHISDYRLNWNFQDYIQKWLECYRNALRGPRHVKKATHDNGGNQWNNAKMCFEACIS